jgi:hypothetical protein
LRFSVLPSEYAICRLGPDLPAPTWVEGSGFVSVTRTADELSIVCPAERVPSGARAERGWVLLQLHGPFPVDAVGILRAVLDPLADAAVGIFALSTFDTDYLLIRQAQLPRALQALAAAGHTQLAQ